MPLDPRYFFGPDGPGDRPPDDFHWHEHHERPHDDHHHHDHHGDHHHHDCHHEHCADECDDQLPAIASVGRGMRGNSYYVTISDPDTCTETYLQGWQKDEVTGLVTKDWESLNINGGELYYQYNLRPYTSPQCFTITFIYRRPGRCEWSWTTPAIPYIWDANKDGQPDVDGIIGSGVGDLYIRTANKDYPDTIDGRNPKDDAWIEKLIFPTGTTAADYNSPKPLEAWSVNLTFGLVGGDVLVPNIYDLASLLGFPAGNVYNNAKGDKGQFDGYDDLKDYIWHSGVVDLYIRTAIKDWSLDDPRFADIWEKSSKQKFIQKFGDPVDDKWNERLHFPPGKGHNDYPLLPEATEPWSSTISYGLEGGDILVPNIYDLMLLLGINPADYYGDSSGDKSNLAEMMQWSAYVQCPVAGHQTDPLTKNMGVNGGREDFGTGGDGVSYIDRILVTYKPACKIFNVRCAFGGRTSTSVTIPSGSKIYVSGMWRTLGYKDLPNWFIPKTTKFLQKYLYFRYWNRNGSYQQEPADLYFGGMDAGADKGMVWIQLRTDDLTIPADYSWEFESYQGIVFYDEWGINNEVDAKGHPLSNVPKPGTDPYAISTLDIKPDEKDYEVHYDYDHDFAWS